MMKATLERFGRQDAGGTADLIRLTNQAASHVALMPVGARLVEAWFPDRAGNMADVVLGFSTIEDYLELDTYAGSIAGRYANRIAGAKFDLDGQTFGLEANEGRNHVHGGFEGLDRQTWDYVIDESAGTVVFTHDSPDGHGGYPGELSVQVTYRLEDDADVLRIELVATTTRPTVLNLVNHSYWNVAGHGSGDVFGQLLQLGASAYTPVDEELLATGQVTSVEGTPFDFRTLTPIGARIHDLPAIGGAGRLEEGAAGGYDHNWVLDGARGDLHLAARMVDPASGRQLTLRTTEPGVQMYTAGYMKDLPGKDGARYNAGAGITLETQTYPCSPNIPDFPSAVLLPGEVYKHDMECTFTVADM